ncbi:TPA: phage coat protein, partial [Klebsiella pneumoniae]|nr:phage coat protein [Klebsiella pneumoniae subsp. pneumoniae]HBX4761431.1 phage coat protein [Klebsiella pneumoniae]
GMQSENLDAMADDQEAHVAAIREDMADYMLSGDAKVKVKGYVGAGITNHANTNQVDLSASGLNIDLTTSTPDESVAFFTGPFAKLLDDNYVQEKVKVWASPDIMRNLNRPYSDAAGFKEG